MNIFLEKLNKIIPVSLFGLFSITAGIFGDIIAFIMFPAQNYNCMTMAVSTLCLGPGGIFFNIGNVVSGVFALIFVNYLIRTFNEEHTSRKLKRIALICANISCISFIILGVFCGSNIVIEYLHGTAAITSWLFGFTYITFYNLFMLKDSNYSKNLALFGFFISFPLLLLMILFFYHLIPIFGFLIIVLPFLEWLGTVSVISWYFSISTYMTYKGI